MPVFIAFAAFLLLVFGHRLGLPIAPWVVTPGSFGNKRKTPGQKSGVRTQTLEMVLDHDSGRMEGRCLKGRFTGRALSSLSQTESLQLLEELRSTDSQGAILMEAFLDRRWQGWRDRERLLGLRLTTKLVSSVGSLRRLFVAAKLPLGYPAIS